MRAARSRRPSVSEWVCSERPSPLATYAVDGPKLMCCGATSAGSSVVGRSPPAR
jgi:hypothetical protein